MAREHYVRPPLVPREAPAAWRAVWPFRVVVLLLLALLTVGFAYAYSALNDTAAQDPGLDASAPAVVPLS
ncbi:MAG: hypothetical protein JWO60_981 [Frankiales bacterium]|nr:hypothetical protein [Frankiales bacterium]